MLSRSVTVCHAIAGRSSNQCAIFSTKYHLRQCHSDNAFAITEHQKCMQILVSFYFEVVCSHGSSGHEKTMKKLKKNLNGPPKTAPALYGFTASTGGCCSTTRSAKPRSPRRFVRSLLRPWPSKRIPRRVRQDQVSWAERRRCMFSCCVVFLVFLLCVFFFFAGWRSIFSCLIILGFQRAFWRFQRVRHSLAPSISKDPVLETPGMFRHVLTL